MKFIKTLFSLLGLLIIAAGVFLYLNFGDLAKNTAEKIASEAMGVKVTIAALDISLTDKRVTVSGINIANPRGFKNRHLMAIQNVSIGLNAASRTLIDFKDISVTGTGLNFEVTEKGTNISALQALMAKNKKAPSKAAEPIKVIIRSLVITPSVINPSVTVLNQDIASSITLPAVRLSGIGQRDNGILAKEAVRQIMSKYLKQAEATVRKKGLTGNADAVVKEIEGKVKDAKNTLKGLFN